MAKFTAPHAVGNEFSKPWNKFFNNVATKIGSSKSYALGGRLTSNTTAVGNVGSGADTLITYSLEANILNNVGDTLEITAFGSQAANANNKTIKLVFGSTELFTTGAVASNGKDWRIDCTIIRTAAATQECITSFSGDTVLVTQIADYVTGTEDFTTSLAIKCTGEATTTDDIIQKGLIIKFFPVG